MTYQFRNERGVLKIYDTGKHLLYWLDRPKGVIDIVALLNEKAAQHSVQSDGSDGLRDDVIGIIAMYVNDMHPRIKQALQAALSANPPRR